MAFEDYKTKDSVVIVYTGEGKGKTSASLGLLARSLGAGWRVAYIQFIKNWHVNEHSFIEKITPLYEDKLLFYKGGLGFYQAGDISEESVSDQQHRESATKTYQFALDAARGGEFDLVICDEINNAVGDGLLSLEQLEDLLSARAKKTSLCITGRNFSESLLDKVDIATHMTKMKHHYDDKYLANNGIDY